MRAADAAADAARAATDEDGGKHVRPRAETLWHVTANEVSPRPVQDRWFGYCQHTPTDMLACDHG